MAWRIKNRPFRIGVGVSLLIVAGSFVLLSILAGLLIGGLELLNLFLAIRGK